MVEEFAGKNHINYLAACGELGTAYNRVGNRKKALENQLLMREGLLKTAYDQGNTLSLADNNIGVTCIDDGRPEEAVIVSYGGLSAGRGKEPRRDRLCGTGLESGPGLPASGG